MFREIEVYRGTHVTTLAMKLMAMTFVRTGELIAAENIFVFMHMNTFNNDSFYSNGGSARFVETTNDTGEVVALSVRLGERLWKDGSGYSKCGVMITELQPETVRQPALWGELDRDRRERA